MDAVARLSGILSGLFQSTHSYNYMNYAKHYLTLDTEVIVELAQGTHKWGKCNYALHAVFWALRSADCAEIVKTMSPEKIAMVREVMAVAKQYKCPDKEKADETNIIYMKKNEKPNLPAYAKYTNNIIRYAALIESLVAENWWEIQQEFNRWDTLLNNREQTDEMTNQPEIKQEKQVVPEIKAEEPAPEIQKETKTMPEVKAEEPTPEVKQTVVVPEKTAPEANEELWTVEQLAKKLGLKRASSFYTKKSLFLKSHPDTMLQKRFKEFFARKTENGVSSVRFRAKFFDELVQMMNAPATKQVAKSAPKTQGEPAKQNAETEELWSITKLAKQLGIASKGAFARKKMLLLERHPEYIAKVSSWFVGKKGLFKAKHFEELKQLIEQNPPVKAEIIITEQYGELWTTVKLARELGLKNSMSWACKKNNYLTKHPDAEEMFNKWFVEYTDSQRRVMFKAKYIEDLKKLFTDKRTAAARAEKRKAKNGAQFIPAIPNIEEKELEIVDDTIQVAETYVPNTAVAPVVEQPKDLVGIQALRVYLEQLQKMYDQECKNVTDAENEYKDLQSKAEEARTKAETSQQRADELKSIITDVTKVVNDWDQASEAFKIANQNVTDQQNKLNQFLKGNTNTLVK